MLYFRDAQMDLTKTYIKKKKSLNVTQTLQHIAAELVK